MDLALTRDVARSITRCELTHIAREPIDYERAVAQHEDYCAKLAALGLEVLRLPADEAYPDCCFVEDVAIVLDEIAVIPCLGAPSRRGESVAIAEALSAYRPLARLELPATLDGGDVLQMGKTLFVGQTLRSNVAGIAALRSIVSPLGYKVVGVPVTGCLHLKSAVSALDEETILCNRAWLDSAALDSFRVIEVAPEEPSAANVLAVLGALFAHPGYPLTIERLQKGGFRVIPVDISEFIKAEAALTCKSILFRRTGAQSA